MNYILALAGFSQSISISAAQTILGIMLALTLWVIYKEGDFSIFKTRLFLAFCLFNSAIFLTFFLTNEGNESVRSLRSFWITLYIFTAIMFVTTGKKERIVMLSIITGGVAASVYSIFVYLSGNTERAVGFMSHALTFGNSLAMIAVFCLYMIFYGNFRSKNEKIFCFLSMPLLITALAMSQSRGPILAFIAVAMLMLIIRFKAKGVAIACAILLLAVAAIFNINSVKNRFVDTPLAEYNESETSIGTRLVLWKVSMQMIKDHPVFGIGHKNFKNTVRKYTDLPLASRAHAHNSFIHHTVTYGLTGLVTLLIFLGVIIQELVKAIRNKTPYAKGVLFVLITFLLCGLTENNLGDSELVMLMSLFIGSVVGDKISEETA